MGKKVRTFAAKLAHANKSKKKICPICQEEIKTIKLIANKSKTSYRPKSTFVHICKCNEDEILS